MSGTPGTCMFQIRAYETSFPLVRFPRSASFAWITIQSCDISKLLVRLTIGEQLPRLSPMINTRSLGVHVSSFWLLSRYSQKVLRFQFNNRGVIEGELQLSLRIRPQILSDNYVSFYLCNSRGSWVAIMHKINRNGKDLHNHHKNCAQNDATT